MSQSKGKLIVVIFVFAILAISSLACGSSSDVAAAPAEPKQLTRQEMMESAYAQDRAVFVQHGMGEGVALCIGTKRAASLKVSGSEYMFEFDSQEALNLCLCRRSSETGNYAPLQNVSGVEPGDYLSWDSSGTLSWTRR